MLPSLCRGKPFPPGVRAPREIRPREIEEDPALALSKLDTLATVFAQELTTQAAARKVRLTHAYFGSLSPRQALQLSIVHTRHHARQLAGTAI
jgi:hypothetical protein